MSTDHRTLAAMVTPALLIIPLVHYLGRRAEHSFESSLLRSPFEPNLDGRRHSVTTLLQKSLAGPDSIVQNGPARSQITIRDAEVKRAEIGRIKRLYAHVDCSQDGNRAKTHVRFRREPGLERAPAVKSFKPMALAAGDKLGPYEILEAIGAGGMGEVYKARDTRLNRFVAIKVLPTGRPASTDLKQRFIQEARAASALNHPNIITIHDISVGNECDYLVMEYLSGQTMEQLISRKELRLRDTLKYAVQVAEALAAAHAAGIGPDQLTRTMLARTEEGTIVGSVPYMSPEQVQGQPLDARSDIFSFGAVLYEMVTGQRPFYGDSRASIIASILKDEPKPPQADHNRPFAQ